MIVILTPVSCFSGEGALAPVRAWVGKYCFDCHGPDVAKGGLNLSLVVNGDVSAHLKEWETVARRLRTRQMPPAGKTRPEESSYAEIVPKLETALDAQAAARPNAGRTDTIRRLNRTEYQNAIRDLLALDIDASAMLPADDSSHGFDNGTVDTLSPTLLERYIAAAQKIARLAVGSTGKSPGGETIRVRPDITQEERVEGLPLGTRGGTLIRYTFPHDGEYEIQVRLTRDRNEHVEGLNGAHEMLVLLDREQVKEFTVKPPEKGSQDFEKVDAHLKLRVPVKAGPHDLGITFLKNPSSVPETLRQPYISHYNLHRHPRLSPAIYQVSIIGPFSTVAPEGEPTTGSKPPVPHESPSRRIFVAQPKTADQEESCARQILSTLLRRAWRRPINETDLARPMAVYRDARKEGAFDAGIEAALSAILVSREFLFRVERDPPGVAPKTAYRISDLELASRLSFFLWSSIPDDELLTAAERGELGKPEVLAAQTRRMLADARSQSLVRNFAGQWLHLRNLDSITPDGRIFPDFDDNLRQALRRETELLFEEVVREDHSVLELLKSDHTYLNERLAKHYGISSVYGPHFRRVELGPDTHRGGLLRQGSVLTVTSYATRTSPVIRGKWILETLIGTPPPPPLPNVPALRDNTVSESLPVRERLALHRANAACASCHNFMDPAGFALENYDALGRWRTSEEGKPVDATGGLPDGSKFAGVSGLEEGLLKRPEVFVGTLTEKLLTYALGRGVEYYDGAAVREVVRKSQAANYRFSAIIDGIVNSTPFRMRQSP
jgi:hypothetical protein